MEAKIGPEAHMRQGSVAIMVRPTKRHHRLLLIGSLALRNENGLINPCRATVPKLANRELHTLREPDVTDYLKMLRS